VPAPPVARWHVSAIPQARLHVSTSPTPPRDPVVPEHPGPPCPLRRCVFDYLATLVAKEYVVYNNPRASTDEVAEEMVRMLVRVRRHLPRRR
jgi:hypothetical protein